MSDVSLSVILPTYNRAHFLLRAVNSVITQLETGDEIIIVDDGSTDNTPQLAKKISGPVRYIRTIKKGAGAARNRGIIESKNELIAFIDSDDEWMPGKVALQKKVMAAMPGSLFCFTNFAIRDLKNREIRFAVETWSKDTRTWDEIIGPGKKISTIIPVLPGEVDFTIYEGDIFIQELLTNYINVNTLIVRKSLSEDALFFNEDTHTYEDWECFGRLSSKKPAIYIDCETAWQNGHSGPRLTDTHPVECALARIPIIEKVWGQNEVCQNKFLHLYQKTLTQQYEIAVGGMIARCDIKFARELIKKCPTVSFKFKLLAKLPCYLVQVIVNLRRRYRTMPNRY